MSQKVENHKHELENLNLEDLEVEELEQRLELAVWDLFSTFSANDSNGCDPNKPNRMFPCPEQTQGPW